jgi:TetR/AcrR family transcriptional regulator, cholesterol catabolism regulator
MAKLKKGQTQKAFIISKASTLFWEKGYAETSMRDIANVCGFRPANIYNFFTSKESILFEILQEEMMEIINPIKSLENDSVISPVEAIRMLIENHVKLTLGGRRKSKLLFDTGLKNLSSANRKKIINLRDYYDSICVGIVERGIKTKIFSAADAKIAVFCIASMIARSRMWYSPGGKYSVDEIVELIYNFALHGLGYR